MWVAIAEAGIKLQPLFFGGYQESRQRGAAVQLAIKKHLANCLDSLTRSLASRCGQPKVELPAPGVSLPPFPFSH